MFKREEEPHQRFQPFRIENKSHPALYNNNYYFANQGLLAGLNSQSFYGQVNPQIPAGNWNINQNDVTYYNNNNPRIQTTNRNTKQNSNNIVIMRPSLKDSKKLFNPKHAAFLANKDKNTQRDQRSVIGNRLERFEQQKYVPLGNINDFCAKLHYNSWQQRNNYWIDKITENTSSVDKQISLFLLAIEADDKFYEKGDQLCQKLKDIVQPYFQGYRFTPKLFGSSKTRLALKDSDFDVYLDFVDGKPGVNRLLHDIADIVRAYKKELSIHTVTPIKARVPIVQCKSSTEPDCDISFAKPLGVYCSSLVKFVISLDKRIRPVILIIKFWLKMNNLLHFSKISSYALVNLSIFYFQQGLNPILPPIREFQKNCSDEKLIDGWNVSFSEDVIPLINEKNNMDEFGLLQGFFNFYKNFNFEANVICTYLGRSILKSDFSKGKLPEGLELYKEHLKKNPERTFLSKNPVWIQDPLIHNFNVARNLISIYEFKKKCREAAVIFDNEYEKSKNGNYKCNLFRELFKNRSSTVGHSKFDDRRRNHRR